MRIWSRSEPVKSKLFLAGNRGGSMVGFRGLDWVYDVTERNNIITTRAVAFQKRVEGMRPDDRVSRRHGAHSITRRAGAFGGANGQSPLFQVDGDTSSVGHGDVAA
jgi:hypothetical protein